MTTEFADERAAIETRFNTMWAGLTPIKFENVEFAQPEKDPWVALVIQPSSGDQASIGTSNPLYRYEGIIIVQVMVPEKSGMRGTPTSSEELCDKAKDIFKSSEFASGLLGKITCRTPRKIVSGADIYGWYQVNVSTRYIRNQY